MGEGAARRRPKPGTGPCPLRAPSAGQYGELTVTPGQPNRLTHLRTGRLTRCTNRPSKQRVEGPAGLREAGRPRRENGLENCVATSRLDSVAG